ncbi:hypothetical protein [Synechococcus sp. CBW1107]|uniref:hypothetical protein n=1 Tax=Synechococcus sp. CBW1107 TaxID=2789857 RepID=UPI002AD3ABC8|nr:hypothetical protein [Synechococcus sp. CBW1107]CAK6696147.1 hypothetical protein ICNINCKA_01967 [Synechococcus sp. CBW1107]
MGAAEIVGLDKEGEEEAEVDGDCVELEIALSLLMATLFVLEVTWLPLPPFVEPVELVVPPRLIPVVPETVRKTSSMMLDPPHKTSA